MKRITFYLCSILLLVGLISSCSSAPEYGKLIPKDAYCVVSLDVEEAVESFDLGDAEVLKEKIDASLRHSKFPPATRQHLDEILENPQNSGFDLERPVMVFASQSFANKVGVLGAVSNQEKLEEFIDIMSREGVCDGVLQREGIRYTTCFDFVLAFTDQWFLVTKKNPEQEKAEDVLAEINKLAAQTEDESLLQDEHFKTLSERDGFAHVLLNGIGVEDVAREMGFWSDLQEKEGLQHVKVSDFTGLCDLVIEKGEARLVTEVQPLTDEAEDYLDENLGVGVIKKDLVNYVSTDDLFFMLANCHGKSIYSNLLSDSNFVKWSQVDSVSFSIFSEVLNAVDGDIIMAVGAEETQLNKLPEMSMVAQMANKNWLEKMDALSLPYLQKIDDRSYAIDFPGIRYHSSSSQAPSAASLVMGEKNGLSYLLFGEERRQLEPVMNPVALDKDYNVYARWDAMGLSSLGLLKKEMGGLELLVFKKFIRLFDYAEFYVENGRKSTFRLVMKDKEQSPVKTIYDEALGLL